MRQRLTDLGEVVGAAVFSVGAGMAWLPLGIMCAGAATVVLCWLVGE